MLNAYYDLLKYEDGEWEDYLNRICLFEIFKDLIAKYGKDKSELKSFIRYIIWAYSKQSDKVIIGNDWEENKKRIFEAAGFRPIQDLLDATVYLKDDVVLNTIQKWLDHQDDDIYSQLKSLQDLQQEMRISSNSDIKKSSGEIDYSQKYLNATYVGELRKMIKDLQDELIQSNQKLKEGYKEVKNATKRNTLSVEKVMAHDG